MLTIILLSGAMAKPRAISIVENSDYIPLGIGAGISEAALKQQPWCITPSAPGSLPTLQACQYSSIKKLLMENDGVYVNEGAKKEYDTVVFHVGTGLTSKVVLNGDLYLAQERVIEKEVWYNYRTDFSSLTDSELNTITADNNSLSAFGSPIYLVERVSIGCAYSSRLASLDGAVNSMIGIDAAFKSASKIGDGTFIAEQELSSSDGVFPLFNKPAPKPAACSSGQTAPVYAVVTNLSQVYRSAITSVEVERYRRALDVLAKDIDSMKEKLEIANKVMAATVNQLSEIERLLALAKSSASQVQKQLEKIDSRNKDLQKRIDNIKSSGKPLTADQISSLDSAYAQTTQMNSSLKNLFETNQKTIDLIENVNISVISAKESLKNLSLPIPLNIPEDLLLSPLSDNILTLAEQIGGIESLVAFLENSA